jgi:hypothetical protein
MDPEEEKDSKFEWRSMGTVITQITVWFQGIALWFFLGRWGRRRGRRWVRTRSRIWRFKESYSSKKSTIAKRGPQWKIHKQLKKVKKKVFKNN